MSVHVSSWVWDNSKAIETTLLVAVCLADASSHEGYCFPSIKRLATLCRVSERTIQRHLQILVELGEIQIDPRMNKIGGQATNGYQWCHGCHPPGDNSDTPPVTAVSPATRARVDRFEPSFRTGASPNKSVQPALTDEAFLAQIKPDYPEIDLGAEFRKMHAWCLANHKQPSRRRFVNWLNRVERPMQKPVARNPLNGSPMRSSAYTESELKEMEQKLARSRGLA